MREQPLSVKIGEFVLTFIVSIFLFPALDSFIASMPSFPLKDLFTFLIPSPQDNILEFLQFLLYWVGAGYLTFKEK
jgi:hypothetical protein